MTEQGGNGDSPRTVQTVETSYDIVDFLESHGERGVTNIAEQVGISKSAAHRHLVTLERHGRVRKTGGKYRLASQDARAVEPTFEIIEALHNFDQASPEEIAEAVGRPEETVQEYLDQLEAAEYIVNREQEYQNGLKFLDIGENVKHNTGIFDIVVDEVDKLAAESGELALFSVMEHGQNVILYKAHGEEAIRTAHETGLREPMHFSALGKAILSELSPDRARQVVERRGLEPATENTITDVGELLDELERTRERGYAVDREEAKRGMRCIAAPVTAAERPLYGAVSLAGPKSRMRGKRFEEEVPDLVKGAANVIELNSIYVD